jgi:hypothetical protein
MPLQPPKKTAAGYFLALTPPIRSPDVRWARTGTWEPPTAEWMAWSDRIRSELLGELLSHGTWFSRPPRHDVLDPLFSPWVTKHTGAGLSFYCKGPEVPGTSSSDSSSGRATWSLQGLIMSSTSIVPVWSVGETVKDDAPDTISLFGDGETVDGSDDDTSADAGRPRAASETREIQIEEIADAPAATPTRIRNREWEARKFLAKERVREARLKAQIAIHLSRKEESRFHTQYGDLDDGESHFSDYDLTDDEGSSSSSSGSDSPAEL